MTFWELRQKSHNRCQLVFLSLCPYKLLVINLFPGFLLGIVAAENDVCVLVNLFFKRMLLSGNLLGFFNTASSSRSISSGSLVSKRSCSGSGITSVGPDEELMSSYFSGVSALSFSFSSIFSGSVSEVSAAVGSFFFRPPCCFPRNRSCFYMPHAQAHSCKPLRS